MLRVKARHDRTYFFAATLKLKADCGLGSAMGDLWIRMPIVKKQTSMTVRAGSSQRLVLLAHEPSTRPGSKWMEAQKAIPPGLKHASLPRD
jgi:hypothetical protein